MSRATRLPRPVRHALRRSQREAVGSSVTTGVCDNYLAAFAIHLDATAQQVGWVTAWPQLIGACGQLASVWLSRHGVRRITLIVGGAAFQSAMVALLVALCAAHFEHAILMLVGVAVLYQVGGHVVQPQWRSMMVELVPVERRGRYFARRSRITAVTSFVALTGGGLMLHVATGLGRPAAGFALLFGSALLGRLLSVRLLTGLAAFDHAVATAQTGGTLGELRRTFADVGFRRFTLFLAAMQGAVAVAGPFFSVHMLRNLGFSYAEFMANLAASLAMQLVTLNSWGTIADHLGNRIILVTTAFLIPLLPLLWIFSGNFWYLLAVQGLAGLAWGGFTLSAGNYLYDLRPAGSELASFAAVQAMVSGLAIFVGTTVGGLIAGNLPAQLVLGGVTLGFASSLYGVFALSALLRLAVALWFTPRVAEIRLSPDATVNQVIVRLARFNPVTGLVMDFIGSVRRRGR